MTHRSAKATQWCESSAAFFQYSRPRHQKETTRHGGIGLFNEASTQLQIPDHWARQTTDHPSSSVSQTDQDFAWPLRRWQKIFREGNLRCLRWQHGHACLTFTRSQVWEWPELRRHHQAGPWLIWGRFRARGIGTDSTEPFRRGEFRCLCGHYQLLSEPTLQLFDVAAGCTGIWSVSGLQPGLSLALTLLLLRLLR